MHFQYSEVVHPNTYDTYDLCADIPLRRHKDSYSEIRGATRAQEDWDKYVTPVIDYKGGIGPNYSFIRVTVPECLPERLEIISYANEFAFLYDGSIPPILPKSLMLMCFKMLWKRLI